MSYHSVIFVIIDSILIVTGLLLNLFFYDSSSLLIVIMWGIISLLLIIQLINYGQKIKEKTIRNNEISIIKMLHNYDENSKMNNYLIDKIKNNFKTIGLEERPLDLQTVSTMEFIAEEFQKFENNQDKKYPIFLHFDKDNVEEIEIDRPVFRDILQILFNYLNLKMNDEIEYLDIITSCKKKDDNEYSILIMFKGITLDHIEI